MSESKKGNNLPTVTTHSDVSMICVDAQGNLKINPLNRLTIKADNLDEMKDGGVYIIGNPVGTKPSSSGAWNYGILEVFSRSGNVYQRFTSQACDMALRACPNGGAWSNWKIFQFLT